MLIDIQEAQTLTSVTPQVLMSNHLKALKLPTFAREYEKVALCAATASGAGWRNHPVPKTLAMR